MLVVLGLLLALATWGFLFALPRQGLWTRSWVAAGVLTAYAVAALATADRLETVVGPVSMAALGTGLGVGAAWLVATHIGHAVLCRLFPGFLAQVNDLYAIRDRGRLWFTAGAVVAMAIAEEVFFRGFLQGQIGLLGAVAAYTAVQLVERKWALALAALLGGTVWGLLFWWTEGLVAPVAAHVLWTGALTFVWPLKGCDGTDPVQEAVAAERSTPASDPPVPQPTPESR